MQYHLMPCSVVCVLDGREEITGSGVLESNWQLEP